MKAGTWRVGTAGYLSCLLFCMLLAMLLTGWRVAIVCALSMALALVLYRPGLAPLRRLWLWAMVAALVLSSTFLGGAPSRAEGLALGAQMALRALSMVVAVTGFAAAVSISDLSGLLEGIGCKGLGFALGVAFNMLPVVQEIATTTYYALRLRGGFRRARLQAARALLVTIVVNSLRHADDIVSAAEARAFSVEKAPARHFEWKPGDWQLVLGLLVAACLVAFA